VSFVLFLWLFPRGANGYLVALARVTLGRASSFAHLVIVHDTIVRDG
jgi:hypothetical protein